ncbi:MAG TPA: lipopolysaccharide heptosyltransferase II [Chlamydiales bacterium]|nr:lipopolysaccharide heptosyltransferase II [Chlamydiales bacterium]
MESIIVRMPNWVGDVVMATPILTDLRKAFPKASITAMCRYPICELLSMDTSIDELYCFHQLNNQFSKRVERRNIIAKIQAGKFDLGLLLTNSLSSAWLFWQGNVKRRIGYSFFPRNLLLTDPIQCPTRKMHQVDRYKELLHPLGIKHSTTPPRLFVTEKEVAISKELLYQRGYHFGKKLVGINPGASYGSAKCWPVDRFRSLAMDLIKDDVFVVFFGDSSQMDLVKKICQDLPQRVINLAGCTSLRELICLIRDCDVVVTNDSGPMHIATALNTPLVALFGSTDVTVTGPYGQNKAVIHKKVRCSPCLKRECPIDLRCMTQISVNEVAQRVRDILYV